MRKDFPDAAELLWKQLICCLYLFFSYGLY